MKKVLLILSSVLLFANSLSAQITIDTTNALPNSGSVYGTDEVRTINFMSGSTLLDQNFDSAGHNFVSDSFNGQMGSWVWYPSDTVLSNEFFHTYDTSGFVIMNSEAMNSDTDYTQRVTLTSPAFSTVGSNVMRIALNHHYRYSDNDSAVLLMASTNGTTWTTLKDFRIDSANAGTAANFARDTFTIYNPQFLNKPSVYLRLLYATDSGYQWAVNRLTVLSNSFAYGYNFFKPGVAQTWDLSNIVYTNESKLYVRKVAPVPYRFIDSMYNEDLLGLRHTSYGLNFYTLDGIIEFGQLTYSQAIPLVNFTGDIADTLFVRVQPELQYSGFDTKFVFPATYGTRWSSNYNYIENLIVKGPTFKGSTTVNNSDTFTLRRYVSVTKRDTIVGWGAMRVKDLAGVVQPYDSVLQLKTVTTRRDSFSLVSTDSTYRSLFNAYLNSTGMSNVMMHNYTTFKYHRRGHIIPFVTVWMNGTSASDTIVNRIEVDIHEPWPAAVGNIELADADVNVYPNPVSNGQLYIEMNDAADGKWQGELLNNLGQVVAAQPLNLGKTSNKSQITVPAATMPGIYYLRISRDGQPVAIKPVSVMN